MKQFYMIPLTMTYYLVRTRNNSRIVEKQVNRVHMMILMKEINVDSAAVGAREEFFMTTILYHHDEDDSSSVTVMTVKI